MKRRKFFSTFFLKTGFFALSFLKPIAWKEERTGRTEGGFWRKRCVSAGAHHSVKHPLQTTNPHWHTVTEVYDLTGAMLSHTHAHFLIASDAVQCVWEAAFTHAQVCALSTEHPTQLRCFVFSCFFAAKGDPTWVTLIDQSKKKNSSEDSSYWCFLCHTTELLMSKFSPCVGKKACVIRTRGILHLNLYYSSLGLCL